jgi:rsbT co-antagonist protein RsbR
MEDQPKATDTLRAELSRCRERIAELGRDTDLLRRALAVLPDPISIFDLEGNYLWWNQAVNEVTGYDDDEMRSLQPTALFAGEDRERVASEISEVVASGRGKIEARLVSKSGERSPMAFVGGLIRDEEGRPVAIATAGRDISERKRAKEEVARQAEEILELSTPVIQIWESVVAVPLIGTLDSRRTQRFAEALLNAIMDQQAQIALIDITGVPAIDTQTAHHLIETVAAVRLLGAEVVLTGVRPAIAQTLVHLGIDLSDITTRSSLAAGLRIALDIIEDTP